VVPNRRRHILEDVHWIQEVVGFQLSPIRKLEKYGQPEQILKLNASNEHLKYV
jgi:hypothetical protein